VYFSKRLPVPQNLRSTPTTITSINIYPSVPPFIYPLFSLHLSFVSLLFLFFFLLLNILHHRHERLPLGLEVFKRDLPHFIPHSRLALLNLQHHILEVDENKPIHRTDRRRGNALEILAPVMLQDKKLASSDEKLTSVNCTLQLSALDGRKHGGALCPVEEAVPIIEALDVDFQIGVAHLGVVLLEFGARFGLVIDPLGMALTALDKSKETTSALIDCLAVGICIVQSLGFFQLAAMGAIRCCLMQGEAGT
jgi:hypothetical protein